MNDDLFALTPDQKRAYNVLYNARSYWARPCKDNPNQWDHNGPAAVAAAIAGCRTCPVLTECAAMVASGVQLDGVVAAQIHGTKEPISQEVREAALTRIRAGEYQNVVAAELDVNQSTVSRWVKADEETRRQVAS